MIPSKAAVTCFLIVLAAIRETEAGSGLITTTDSTKNLIPVSSDNDRRAIWRNAVYTGRRASRTHDTSCDRFALSNKHLKTGDYHFSPPTERRFNTPFDRIIGRGRLYQVDVNHNAWMARAREGNSYSAYQNLFDPSRGLIICDDNDKNRDFTEDKLHLSDILFESYRRVALHQLGVGHGFAGALGFASRQQKYNRGRLPKPRFIVRAHISTPATQTVLEMAHEAKRPRVTDILEVTPGEEVFEALLGTIHGKSILYMLSDYCAWAQRRRVLRIYTTKVLDHGSGRVGNVQPGWYMLFELG